MKATATQAEIIDIFLESNNITANDLARYLELHHDFCCYSDVQYDN
jgi:hypothetical protein